MAGPASAWAMARREPEYRREMDAATRCSGVCLRLSEIPWYCKTLNIRLSFKFANLAIGRNLRIRIFAKMYYLESGENQTRHDA